MDFNRIKNYYDSVYKDQGETSFPFDKERYLYWFDFLPVMVDQDAKSLDIGCGVGFACSMLKEKQYQVYGIDISEDALKVARRLVPHGTFSMASESGRVQYPDNTFDLVTCFGVLEHIPDPLNSIKECYRVIKGGHYALFVVPNSWSPYFWVGGTDQIYEVPRSYQEWCRMFRAAGFDIVRTGKDPGPMYQHHQSMMTLVKISMHKLLNLFPIYLTYQFIFLLRKQAQANS